jgi:hypothetical protein
MDSFTFLLVERTKIMSCSQIVVLIEPQNEKYKSCQEGHCKLKQRKIWVKRKYTKGENN